MASKKSRSKRTFEQSIQRLEQIVEDLEQGNVPLDDALNLYEEGLELSKACVEKLTQSEIRLKKLSKDMNGSFHLIEDEGRPESERD